MRSLRTKILTIVLAFLALTGVAFVIFSLFTARNYKRLRLEGIEKTVEFETEKVNKTIAEIERGAIFLATGGQLSYEARSKALGEKMALEFFRSFPVTIGGGFWFAPYAHNKNTYREGFYAFYDRPANAVRLDDTFFTDEYDYHNSSWYIEISANLTKPYQVAWTAPYVDDSGSHALMTTAGAGVFGKDNKLIALSTVDWEIDEVIDELSAIKPTEGSFVLLCAPEKDYIISNTYAHNGAGASLASVPWDIAADYFDLDGVNYKTFRRVMDNGWLLSVQIPTQEIFAEMERQNNRFSMIIALSSALMLFGAFYLVSSLINRPLRKLTQEVSMLGLGNLDIRASINTKDELGILAGAFNKMTADLKESIENLTLVTAEKERIGAELDVAAKIQASMLPCIFPAFPERSDFDIYASMQPAKEVGGDFYDFFLVDDNTLAILVADVSGKGVPAALFMVIAKTLIKNNAQYGKSPREVFNTVNNQLREGNQAHMFVTAFMGYLDIPSGKFTFVNAGHNPPLLRSGDGKFDWLKVKPGFVLAGMKGMSYTHYEIVLQPGDELFLYTDGASEATNSDDLMYGDNRLLETANAHLGLSSKEFVLSMKCDIDNFADGAEQADDITMLALRYRGISMSELSIPATLENTDAVIEFLGEQLGNCPPKIRHQIEIAAEEIFTNIARYAYHPLSGNAVVRVAVGEDAMIEFEDTGAQYDPLAKDDPDVSPTAEREVGGLGIFMVKNIMDSVDYRHQGNKNILTIKKRLGEL
ncbi:MAG: SpoIIE family protein phosphatase [Holophagaceae bacterium]|nr:SpoIIE family protein phosphatase [Holophagaceae bacterium]